MPVKMIHTIAARQQEKGEEGWFSFVGRSSRNEERLNEMATAVNHHTDSISQLINAVNELDARLEKLEPTKPTKPTNATNASTNALIGDEDIAKVQAMVEGLISQAMK